MYIHKFSTMIAAMVLAAPLAAQSAGQSAARCPAGPGAAFGITGYQCANCGWKVEKIGQRVSYTFFAEPVVTAVDPTSIVATGDVIEAVNGQPITTNAGADQFAFPAAGVNSLTVRRGRDRQILQFTLRGPCVGAGASVNGAGQMVITPGGFGSGGAAGAGRSSGGGAGGFRQVGPVRDLRGLTAADSLSSNLVIGDSILMSNLRGVLSRVETGTGRLGAETGRFGFAVECHPSCSMKRTPSGSYYYKYDGYPAIVAVREGSPAERAGVHVGDRITKIDGRSILDEEGTLQRAEETDQARLTVLRDGKELEFLVRVVR